MTALLPLTPPAKRGGARVIYYYYSSQSTIYFLTAYSKDEMTDLTSEDKKTLKSIVALLKK